MSDFVWCHGPSCHTSHTVDRVRGSKGNKVLRTRKIKINEWNKDNYFKYFCSQGCLHDFMRTHIQRIVALDPRHEALETPIEDPTKETTEYSYGSYTRTIIKEIDNESNVG